MLTCKRTDNSLSTGKRVIAFEDAQVRFTTLTDYEHVGQTQGANYVAPDGEQPHTDDAEGCAHPDLAQIDNT